MSLNENTNHQPLVTVLMCVYNDTDYLPKAIESILNQTFTDFEFIIVDDGSTDETPALLTRFAEKDSRIKILRKENSGTTASANFGLSHAKGKYIARIDSDDISYPDRLKIEAEFLKSHPDISLVGGGAAIIDNCGNIVGLRNIKTSNAAKNLQRRNIYQQSDVMFKTETARLLGGYREKIHNGEDYDLWLRISEVAGIAKLNNILGKWRLNEKGYSFARRSEQKYFDGIIKEFAKQRRASKKDGYDSFIPPPPEKSRSEISGSNYKTWIILYLIESYRLKEARAKIREEMKLSNTRILYLLFLITLVPKPFLKMINSLRNYFKNNFI